MVLAAIALLVLSSTMNWTSNTALLNERNNQLSVTLSAAEAATEKVLTRMLDDYKKGNESAVYLNLGSYRTNIPTVTENSLWVNFAFSDALGNSNRTYVDRIASQSYVNLSGQYAGLSGFASTYRVLSNAKQTNGRFVLTNAVQQDLQLASIPVFQFAIFYNSLLEFTWAAPFTIRGRVHANQNIYTGSASPLFFDDVVTATGVVQKRAWAGYSLSAMTGSITYQDGKTTNVSTLALPIGTNNTAAAVREVINIPPATELMTSAMGQQRYYNKAELTILVSNSTVTAQVKQPFSALPTPIPWVQLTNFVSTNKTFTDQREGKTIQTTEVDIARFNSWAQTNALVRGTLGVGVTPNLLFVGDMRTATSTTLPAVRVVNGQTLSSRGLTLATPNPLYVKGHYNCPVAAHLGTTNTTAAMPASLASDALTIQSGAWTDSSSSGSFLSRDATATTVNAAMLTGIVYSQGSNGSTPFSGGVMNLPRLLEDWGNGAVPLTLNGSIINLYDSVRATAPWQTPGVYYYAPTRDFNFDQNYLDSTKLPPGTPSLRTLIRGNWSNPMANVTNYAG
jgi:hypothetical protein